MEGEKERREAEGGEMIEEEDEEVEEFYIPLEFVDYQGTNLLQTFKNYSLIVRRASLVLCLHLPPPPTQCPYAVEGNARVLIMCRA